MKFKYSTTLSPQRASDAIPRVEMGLAANGKTVLTMGLVDSGSTINVLPYQVGLDLGYAWNDQKATVELSGNLALLKAAPVSAEAT